MEEKTYKLWDVIIKALGFLATAASIYFGLTQFEREQRVATDLEFKRNFWQKQNELYAEVCKDAGSMAASVNKPDTFQKIKQNFLNLYYGELILVEDKAVDQAMRNLKAYLDVYKPEDNDENMNNSLKLKVIALSEACKSSSQTFKRANLAW